jgi:predicted ATP-grasp superfamily ATP-dependent carboligase
LPSDTATRDQARAAKEQLAKAIRGTPGVVGVGLTKRGEGYAVKVNLREPLPPERALPDRVGGVPVVTEIVGSIAPRAG